MVAVLQRWSDRGLLANYVTQTSIGIYPVKKFVEVPIPVPTPAERGITKSRVRGFEGRRGILVMQPL